MTIKELKCYINNIDEKYDNHSLVIPNIEYNFDNWQEPAFVEVSDIDSNVTQDGYYYIKLES